MKIQKLHALFLTCHTVCTDTRKLSPDALFFALKGDNFNGNMYAKQALKNGAKYAVIDDEHYNTKGAILVDNVLETLQKLATYHRQYLQLPIIALTGSNGKTTTKELINAVLSKTYKTTATVGNLNNHIGVPLTLLAMTDETEIGIVEMGANHQKEIAFLCDITQPDYGLITNFGKAHLEGFGGVEGVIKGKSEMYTHLANYKKIAFINANDTIQLEKTTHISRFTFGQAHADINIKFIDANPFVKLQYKNLSIESQLIGDYNFTNIAIAITIGYYFKVPDQDIKAAIETYIPSNNRSQIIKRGTNKIILDAYNANPTSMKAALLNFSKQNGLKLAVLGDMFELGKDAEEEHQNIVELATTLNINTVILVGKHFSKTLIHSKKVKSYKLFSNFIKNFNFSEIMHTHILIKGSRGIALERVLDYL